MAMMIPNSFTSYSWATEEEELGAMCLTLSNKQWIQNELSLYSMSRLNLTYDVAHPETFIQAESELKGKITVLQWMLDASTAAEKTLAENAAARNS